MIIIPGDLIEALFGSNAVPYVKAIIFALIILPPIFYMIANGQRKANRNTPPKKNQGKKYEYGDPYLAKTNPGPDPKASKFMSESGWTWNEDTKLWEPPEGAGAEARKKWTWDEDKQIWVDVEQQKRLERYKAFREREGKGPTFEEWKAAREAERQKDAE